MTSGTTTISTPSPQRPLRVRIHDELGRPRTLGQDNFINLVGRPFAPCTATASLATTQTTECLSDTRPILLLGLGTNPADTAEQLHNTCPNAPVFWLEAPEFAAQQPSSWHEAIPTHWTRLDPANDLADPLTSLFQSTTPERIGLYAMGSQLFSAFWHPLLGLLERCMLLQTACSATMEMPPTSPSAAPPRCHVHQNRTVILPGTEGDLLTFELEQAVRALGLTPFRLTPDAAGDAALREQLRAHPPQLFLSVNLRGLDPAGTRFRLLRACGVPVALWFVDNPWHILSALRTPWWRELALFVTDASFIEPLKQHGASFVRHLPLGAWMPEGNLPITPPLRTLTFVGRAAFPERDRFFAGCRVPAELLHTAQQHLHEAPPHVHWWTERLGININWPEKTIRQAGFAADACSALRRLAWLRAAHSLGLTLFGDAAWQEGLPDDTDLRPQLDYYTTLASVYRAAPYTLNVTGLLLPEGLTQRHFDVWTAGGFLLTDASPGLQIFPDALVKPIVVSSPQALAERVHFFATNPQRRQTLAQEWRHCLLTQHSYQHRMQTLCQELQIPLC